MGPRGKCGFWVPPFSVANAALAVAGVGSHLVIRKRRQVALGPRVFSSVSEAIFVSWEIDFSARGIEVLGF